MRYGLVKDDNCPFCGKGLPKIVGNGDKQETISVFDVKYCFACGAALELPDEPVSEVVTIDECGDIFVGDTYMMSADNDSAGMIYWECRWRQQGETERADKFEKNILNIKKMTERRYKDGT